MIDDVTFLNLAKSVDLLRDDLISLTQQLIRIPSVNPCLDNVRYAEIVGGETKVNRFLQQTLEEMRLETDLWEAEKGRANLVGKCKGTGRGRSIIFNGHADTVGTGPENAWTVAGPFSGMLKDGKIYGRGATDMKGGIASAIIALKALLLSGYRPQGNVFLEIVSGEEMMNTEIGTGSAIARGYRADAAVVMEPSGAPYRLAIVTTSPGTLILTITIKGKAAHTLLRHEIVRAGGAGHQVAVSAIEKAMLIFDGLIKLEQEWGQTKFHPAYSQPGCFTLCPTTFAGGWDGLAFIPDRCTLKYVIWYSPYDTANQVKEEITNQIWRYAQLDSWLRENPPELDWHDFGWPAYDLPVDSPICIAAQAAYQKLFQVAVQPVGFMGVDDASFLNAAGISTITLGPGTTHHAHTINEFIDVKDLIDAAKLYALLIAEWCGIEKR
jgi:acetylornithine deacetylase/succinyl-diaminopimelate desuccinylase family protein